MSIYNVTKVKNSVTDKNVKAFLKVIRIGEGTSGADGYHIMFTGTKFSDLSKHPNIKHCAGSLCSTAAGAYQFLYRTWTGAQSALSLPDFSEQSQDLAAVYLINQRGALDDVIAGRFSTAVEKCNREWASLPGSPYGQPTVNLATITNKFKEYGGSLTA